MYEGSTWYQRLARVRDRFKKTVNNGGSWFVVVVDLLLDAFGSVQ